MTKLAKAALSFCVAFTVLVLLLSFTPVVPFAAGQLATDWYEGDADVLIVLGGSMLVSGTGANATLGYDSYLRCVYAWWNIQRFNYSWVVVTGYDGVAEAMAAFLRDRGLNPKSILIENKAESTYQNAQYVIRLLQTGIALPSNPRIALLTSDYHSRRSRQVFEHAGLHVRVIPVPDLIKQSHSPVARWSGFFVLVEELSKYATYAAAGRL